MASVYVTAQGGRTNSFDVEYNFFAVPWNGLIHGTTLLFDIDYRPRPTHDEDRNLVLPSDVCNQETCLLHIEEEFNWFEASRICQANEGYLASIHTPEQNTQVQQLVNSYSAWIGTYRSTVGAGYTWTDGSTTDFMNWEAGRPMNGPGFFCPGGTRISNTCVRQLRGYDGAWIDLPDYRCLHGGVLEYPKSDVVCRLPRRFVEANQFNFTTTPPLETVAPSSRPSPHSTSRDVFDFSSDITPANTSVPTTLPAANYTTSRPPTPRPILPPPSHPIVLPHSFFLL